MHFVYNFDSTLFKTSSLWEAWVKVLKDYGGDEEEIIATGESLFGQGFTLEGHGSLLRIDGPEFKKSVQKFHKLTREVGPSLVFEDVLPFLEDRDGQKQTILTFGNHDYQHAKILASEIMDFIDDVRIANLEQTKALHLRELVESGTEQIVFVDDNPRELVSVHDAGLPITLIRMIRDGEKHAEEEHEGDDDLWTCVTSLEEMQEHI